MLKFNLQSVSFQIGSPPVSDWVACKADDGSFDSKNVIQIIRNGRALLNRAGQMAKSGGCPVQTPPAS